MTDGALTTAQARALGAPARQTILTYLADADRPVPIAELTEHLRVNHNAVRKHLAKLVEAGLVIEEHETRTEPGRPRLLYRLRPDAPVGVDQSYRRLAVLLATALATGDDPAAVGRRAAATSHAADRPDGTARMDALAARFAAEGFEPAVRQRGARTDIVLQRCPYVDAAVVNPDAVCRLHLGLAQGTADAIGGLEVEGLTAKDPRRAGCLLRVR